ncbi:MAG: kelch motif-containing protein [Chloroflexi bacterium]|nr:kelch motif-containing protein [Chloroflexota bacterium]
MNAGIRVRLRALGALGLLVALLAGCSATATPSPSASPSPSGAPPASAGTPSTPPASASPSATAAATAAASTVPTAPPATPAPLGTWVPAGPLPNELYGWGVAAVAVAPAEALLLARDAKSAARWDATNETWVSATPMNAERHGFAAVTLQDATVLVAGGVDQRELEHWRSYSSAYIYDPTTPAGTWTKQGLMGTARTIPAAAVLPDGRVLVAGGSYIDGSPWEWEGLGPSGITLAAFDPGRSGSGRRGIRRFDDSAAPSAGAALATAEIFDPATGRWTPTGSMRFARAGAQAVTLADGRVLVVGPSSFETGEFRATMDARVFDTAEVFDPATGRFTLVGSLPPIDRIALSAQGVTVPTEDPWMTSVGSLVALPDGGAVLIAHHDAWKHQADVVRDFRFDAATGQWTQIGPTWASSVDWGGSDVVLHHTEGIDRSGASVAPLPDGRVLEAGGSEVVGEAGDLASSSSARAWDPATGEWSPLPAMPAARSYGAAAALLDGSIMIAGGDWSESGPETSVRYVP